MTETEATSETRRDSREGDSALPDRPQRFLRSDHRRGLLGATLVGLIALALSCVDLTARSIWLDESATLSIASQNGHALWHAIANDGGNMSGYYLLLHELIAAFGDGVAVLRLPSAVATGLTAYFVSLVSSRLFNNRAGLAAGMLSAISMPLVYWGQDARGYALMVMFVTASFYFLVELDQRAEANLSSRWAWVGYLLTTILGTYMSYVALLGVLAQLIWLSLARRPLRRVAFALAIAVVCWVPLLVWAVDRGTSQLAWLGRPGLLELSVVVSTVASASLQPLIHRTATSDVLEVLTAVVVVGALGLAAFDPQERALRRGVGLIACWIAAPVVLAFAESYVTQPVFLSRNLLMCLPPVGIAVGLAIAETRIPRTLGLAAIVAVGGLRVAQLVPSYSETPENWLAATAYVIDRARPHDCIAFYPSDGRQAFDYYVLHTRGALRIAPRPILPSLPLRDVRPYVEVYTTMSVRRIKNVELSCARLWFVASHTGGRTGTPSSRAHYVRYEQLLSRLSATLVPVQVAHFGWADPVRVELFSSTKFVKGRRA
jgi:mannosyltransferase